MITFATGNAGKFADLEQELAPYGLTCRQQKLPLIEPQEISIPEIARLKAEQAYAQLGTPVVVEDSGLCLHAFNDFPEALTKPVIERVGADGILRMLDGCADRSCHFICALAYADAGGIISVMTSAHERGVIAATLQGALSPRARSPLWQIFQPDGWDKPMAAMDESELTTLWAQWRPKNVFATFAKLASQQPQRFGFSADAAA